MSTMLLQLARRKPILFSSAVSVSGLSTYAVATEWRAEKSEKSHKKECSHDYGKPPSFQLVTHNWNPKFE